MNSGGQFKVKMLVCNCSRNNFSVDSIYWHSIEMQTVEILMNYENKVNSLSILAELFRCHGIWNVGKYIRCCFVENIPSMFSYVEKANSQANAY